MLAFYFINSNLCEVLLSQTHVYYFRITESAHNRVVKRNLNACVTMQTQRYKKQKIFSINSRSLWKYKIYIFKGKTKNKKREVIIS